jgi:cytochrome bd-type quinol oxidase subunit 2
MKLWFALKSAVVLVSVFAPFIMLAAAWLLLPSEAYIAKSSKDVLDWAWLIFAGGMILGIYYFTLWVVFEHMGRSAAQD